MYIIIFITCIITMKKRDFEYKKKKNALALENAYKLGAVSLVFCVILIHIFMANIVFTMKYTTLHDVDDTVQPQMFMFFISALNLLSLFYPERENVWKGITCSPLIVFNIYMIIFDNVWLN